MPRLGLEGNWRSRAIEGGRNLLWRGSTFEVEE